MKKRLIVLSTILAMSAVTVVGCGSAQETPDTASQTETVSEASTEVAETPEATEETEEESVGLANPWVDITEDEANSLCGRLFEAPDGAQDVVWSKCEDLGDADNGIGPMIQLSFTLDDLYYTARAQQGAAEDTDIAGNYVEWTVGPEDATLANWAEGNMPAKTYRAINDTGYVDMITWYDIEIGISYSLSVSAADLDGFDIQGIAEQMAPEDNGFMGNMADDFLQEQSGKTSFESYDEVIAALTTGQGYAYIKLDGSDEEVLAVTDLVFEADHSAYEISLYGKPEGQVKQLGLVSGNGSAYPLRAADGVIYAGDNHNYETYFLSAEYGSLMMKDYISDGVDTGSNEFTGFTREKNSLDETTDFTGGQEEFDKLISERENKPVIEFTMVE